MSKLKKKLKADLAALSPDQEAIELYNQLVNKLYAIPSRDRLRAYWAMDKPSFDYIGSKWPPEPGGDPYWMLGKRVVIRPAPCEPRIELLHQHKMIPLEPGESILYTQCHDPDCPDIKPGTHHAHGKKQ